MADGAACTYTCPVDLPKCIRDFEGSQTRQSQQQQPKQQQQQLHVPCVIIFRP